jgi:DNA-nicking Smr family endonuclease
MSQPPSLTTSIDLHGKLVVDAISEVTLFLERIRRRTGVNSSTGSSGAQNVLFVQIITGSGSVCFRISITTIQFGAFLHLMNVS